MTLVVVGHQFEKESTFSLEKDAEGTPRKSQ